MELCADPMDSILYSTGKYESNDDGLLEIIPSFLSKISARANALSFVNNFRCDRR